MQSLSLSPRAPFFRALTLVFALLLPHILSAGQFYSPGSTVQVNVSTDITYYGTYGYTQGVYVPVEVLAPGSSTWTTIAYGVTGYYGSLSVSTQYTFGSTGTWYIRIGYDTKAVQVVSG